MTGRLALALWLAGLALLSSGPGDAADSFEDVSHIRRLEIRPQTAGFSATLLETREEIAVVEVEGDYGIADDTLRFAAMHEYYTAFPDEIDFVVAFTTFDFDSGGAAALATLVRNDVQGIGLSPFDHSALFGSSGRLESFVDMKNIAAWETNPLRPEFDRTLSVLVHEIQHRWGSYIEFEDGDGHPSSALLGRDDSHWSYLLDSQASVLYGADWEGSGNGTFTATSTLERLSPLDLYLAGLLAPDDVPPIGLIENPAVDPTALPELGAVVDGELQWIEIEDVIAAEGPRLPASQDAPSSFRIGFMLLTQPGHLVSESMIAGIRRIRSQVATRFAVLTGGRGILQVEPSVPPDREPGLPGGITGTGNQPTANFESGLEWLALQRSSLGYFEDAFGTRERDTVEAVATLLQFDETFDEVPSLDWLSTRVTQSVDALARREHLLHDILPTQSTELVGYQDGSGGFGISSQFDPDPLDSALALEVLSKKGLDGIEAIQNLLMQLRNPDGGWSPVPGGPSRTSSTAHVLRALGTSGAALPEESVAFLLGRQNPDGGFGDSPSTSHDTAMVLLVLAENQVLPTEVGTSGLAFLLSRQSLDFSWDGSVYATSLALRAWSRLVDPPAPDVDLAVLESDLSLEGDALLGQDVLLGATVRNLGAGPADAFDIRFLVDDGQDGVELHYERVQLGGGEALQREIPWRVDRLGSLTFEVTVDLLDEIIELDEENNQARLDFEAGSANQVNWTVEPEALTLVPSPGLEGRPLLASLEVTNWGGVASPAIEVALYDGDPAMGAAEVARGLLPALAPAQQGLVTLEWANPAPTGSHLLVAIVDPDYMIDEIDETDNLTFASLEVISLPDAAISGPSLSLFPSRVDAGQLVRLTALVSNLGAQATGPLVVRGLVGSAVGEGVPVAADQIVDVAPGSTQTVIFEWTYDGGASVVSVLLDPSDAVREGDESNNIANIGIAEPSSDFFVSERYFSPNGDGIRDVTRFYFAVPSPQDLTVEIISDRGDSRVLEYQGPELIGATAGSYEWDGRDAAGRVVADGEYRFVVSSAEGLPLGIATTTLDTDRRPLLEAAGTAFERTRNLTCAPPTVERWLAGSEAVAMTSDEQWFYLTLDGSLSYPAGLYRMRPDGRSLMQVVSHEDLGSPIRDLALSPDGQWLAFSDARWDAGSLSNFLMVGRPDGSELRSRLDLGADWVGQIVGFDSQSRIILSEETSILAVAAEGIQPPEVVFSTTLDELEIVAPEAGDAPFSRDRALLRESGPSSTLVGELSILDLDSGQIVGLDTSEFSRLNGFSWSRDGRRLGPISG